MKEHSTHPSIRRFILKTALLAFLLTAGFLPESQFFRAQTVIAATVNLSSKKEKLTEGSSFNMKLIGASGKVKWVSKNKNIAVVDAKGTVTAVSEGKTVIKAKNKGKVYKCKLTVLPAKDEPNGSDTGTPQESLPSDTKSPKDEVTLSAAEAASKKRLQDMIDSCEDKSSGDTIYELSTPFKVYSSNELTDTFVLAANTYSDFSILFANPSLIPSEYEMKQKFPAFDSITYKEIIKFVNGYGVQISVDKGYLYDDDLTVLNIVRGGDTSFATDEDRLCASTVFSVASACKAADDYQTVRNIHDYLVSNTVYTLTPSEYCHTIKACILDHKCVCDGYAKTFRILCEANNIACLFVPGIGNGNDHAWNKVLIDGRWYNVDCTFDDPVPDSGANRVSHNYFCLTDAVFEASGYIWDHAGFPVADSDLYDENKSLFAAVPNASNREELKSIIDTMLGAGHDFFAIALSDKSLYNEVLPLVSASPNKPNFNGSIEVSAENAGSYGYLVSVSIVRQ